MTPTDAETRKRRRWPLGLAVSAIAAGLLPLAWRPSNRRGAEAAETAVEGAPVRPAGAEASSTAPRSNAGDETRTAARAAVGRRIFFDADLSEPRGTSCASCHDPARAFSGANGATAGVARGSRPGHFAGRSTPSLLYLKYVKKFHFHWEEDMPLPDARAGLFWDGRADTVAAAVRQPLLHPDEMNNRDGAQIADKLRSASYASDLVAAFGAIDDTERAWTALGQALEAFLLQDEMAPFSSKFDDVLRGTAKFTDLETRGFALFKDREKGNCLSCHKMDESFKDPKRSLFTDYGYEVVGVPRNRAIPANDDPKHFDLGMCARPGATAAMKEPRFCGAFRTPSLRNVAVRPSFMHNGAFTKLRDVVAFYASRDLQPTRWYRNGTPYDDLPTAYREHVNTDAVPYVSSRGRPRLDDAEIDAIVAFLETLTDAAYR